MEILKSIFSATRSSSWYAYLKDLVFTYLWAVDMKNRHVFSCLSAVLMPSYG